MSEVDNANQVASNGALVAPRSSHCYPAFYEQDGITIYNARCEQVLPFLDPVDLVLTDPPYGIGDKWADGVMAGKRGTSRLWGNGEDWDRVPPPMWLIEQVIGSGADAIIWGGNYFGLRGRGWLIWDKVQTFSGSDAELAWTTFDAPVRTFRLSRIDAYQNCTNERKQHPTQKPLGLMKWAIRQAPDTVQTVLDPFMGVGTTLVAAKLMGKRGIGIEVSTEYCERAVERLRQGVLPFSG